MISNYEYDNLLKAMNNRKGYIDPDNLSNKAFYKEYCKVLKANLKKIKDDYKNKDKIIYDKLNKIDLKCDNGIQMTINKKEQLQLKSDQFGFSAKANKGKNDKYPRYDKYPYFNYINNLEETKRKSGCEKVFGDNGWINKTRLVGGSFLWPIDEDIDQYKKNPQYNLKRGGNLEHYGQDRYGSYIQDRVDLTLYEVKEVYENIIVPENKQIINGNELTKWLFNKDFKETNNYIFLEAFGNFKTFCKVFGFYKSFVTEDLKIIDIFKTNKNNLDKPTTIDKNSDIMLLSYDTTADEFENMFEVLVELIKKRRENLCIVGGKE